MIETLTSKKEHGSPDKIRKVPREFALTTIDDNSFVLLWATFGSVGAILHRRTIFIRVFPPKIT